MALYHLCVHVLFVHGKTQVAAVPARPLPSHMPPLPPSTFGFCALPFLHNRSAPCLVMSSITID